IVGEALDDDGVAPERHVGPMLLARADRHDQPRIALDCRDDFRGTHFLDPLWAAAVVGRRVRMSHMASEDRVGATSGWRGSGWIIASSIALLSTSRWLSATTVEYLVIGATATALAAAVVSSLAMAHRRWAVVSIAALGFAIAVGATTQSRLARLHGDWAAERLRMERSATSALDAAVQQATGQLRRQAARALDAPGERSAAVPAPDD